jgi:hypothetical protein
MIMKHRPVVEQGTTKNADADGTLRGLKELEKHLRQNGIVTGAKVCADAARVILGYKRRDMKAEGDKS